jgi:hypothetical protein
VVYGAGTFVAIADATPNPITAIWSTDGMNWTASTSALSSVDGVWTALGFGTVGSTSYFVAIGGANNSTSYAAYSSDNGATWTAATTPLGPADWSGVAFGTVAGGSPMFVAIAGPAPGSGPSPAAYSTDGKNWVTTPMAMPANEDWASVAYGMIGSTGYFVAVSASGAAYSTDGKTWTASPCGLPAGVGGQAVTFGSVAGHGVFMVMSAGGPTAAYSEDGINWYSGTSPNEEWQSVAYGGGTFVTLTTDGVTASN